MQTIKLNYYNASNQIHLLSEQGDGGLYDPKGGGNVISWEDSVGNINWDNFGLTHTSNTFSQLI